MAKTEPFTNGASGRRFAVLEPRMRKRRSNRCAQPNRLDVYVVLFAFGEDSKPLAERRYRSLSLRMVKTMVEAGDAEAFVEQTANGATTFYRELKLHAGLSSASPATLTLGTMDAVACRAFGDKLTRGQREQVTKFDVWPLMGDTKAVAVRPRISDADRRRAENLLRGTAVRSRCEASRRGEIRTLHNSGGTAPLAVAA